MILMKLAQFSWCASKSVFPNCSSNWRVVLVAALKANFESKSLIYFSFRWSHRRVDQLRGLTR